MADTTMEVLFLRALGRRGQRMVLLTCVIITVLNTAETQTPPTMSEDKKVNKLYQLEVATKSLFTVTCTTTPATSGCVVDILSMQPSSPCSNCFAIFPCNTADFCLHYVSGQGSLDPGQANQYGFTLRGIDLVNGKASYVIVDVRITANSPPYFDYPAMSTLVKVPNSKTQPAGYVIHVVNAQDDDGDALSFSMVLQPNVVGIDIDELSGTIRSTKALRTVCINEFVAMVTVDDGHNDPVGPFLVNIFLQGANDPPFVNNLDGDLYVREDEPVDNVVLTLAAFDTDLYPVIYYTVTTTPLSAMDVFLIEGNELKLKEPLDHEKGLRAVTLTVQASDGYCSSEVYTLKIHIVDVNEAPLISPADQTLDQCEGLITVVPSWNVTDPDAGDSVLFTGLEPNDKGIFKINHISGAISTVADYDLDKSNKLKASEVLTVTVRDKQLFTSTATVTIRFSDCNDNYPIFDKSAKSFPVSECDPAGTAVFKLEKEATDADSDYQQNNLLTFHGSGTGATVELGGQLLLTSTFTAGQVSTFPVYATDQGKNPGPKTSLAPLWVSIYGEKCVTPPPPVTTTTIAPLDADAFNNGTGFGTANREWVIAASVLGALLLVLVLYMLCMYAWPGMGRPPAAGMQAPGGRSRLQPYPQHSRSPASRPSLPSDEYSEDPEDRDSGWDTGSYEDNTQTSQQALDGSSVSPPFDGFWKESFANEDYTSTPNRNALPEPCKPIAPPPKIASPTNIAPIIPLSQQAGPPPDKV